MNRLNPWFYEVEIYGKKVTPGIYPNDMPGEAGVDAEYLISRQRYRGTLLIDEVARRFDFAGARVLDLGCNCGYWSAEYLKLGAESIVGIEGRKRFFHQAMMYYQSLGFMNKATFIHGNVMDVDFRKWGPFEFVLCAGILYHVKEHGELLRRVAEVNTDVLVLDTRVHDGGMFHVEKADRWFNAIEETRDKKIPDLGELLDLLGGLGYGVEVIPPEFRTVRGVGGPDDYNAGRRACIFCRKRGGKKR